MISKGAGPIRAGKLRVAIFMTGGTIAKSYDPKTAQLYNFELMVKLLVDELRTDDLQLTFFDLMHKDSLEIGADERHYIVEQVGAAVRRYDAIIITHGTDKLPDTAQDLYDAIDSPAVPVIFTGSMVPYTIMGSDARQNMTEALLAIRLVPAGIYIVFHNRILTVPDIRKNHETMTFEGTSDGEN
ncbi:MAG: asparaginase domain-containing protein [Rhizobiaceae bacterium]